MLSRRALPVTAAVLTGLVVWSTLPLEAGFKRNRGYDGLEQGYVVAESRFGNGMARGAVREARHGPQVQLPGGTWEYCRTSCSETLRVETVDKFENADLRGLGGLAQECGIFGCLDLGVRWRD